MGMRQPKGLVIDVELDDFRIRHIDDGLAGLRQSIRLFRIEDRPGFIKPIDEGAVLPDGPSFLEAPPHAEVAVAEREHRLALLEQTWHVLLLDDVPLVRWIDVRSGTEAWVMDHNPSGCDGDRPGHLRPLLGGLAR